MKKRSSYIADRIDFEYRRSKRMEAKIAAKKEREAKEKKKD